MYIAKKSSYITPNSNAFEKLYTPYSMLFLNDNYI